MVIPEATNLKAQSEAMTFPPSLLRNWAALRKRAVGTAQLHPNIPDYIVLPWVNKNNGEVDLIDHDAERQAAEILWYVFTDTQPNYILAIANSGLPLGKAVSGFFPQAQYLQATKYEERPAKDGYITVQAHSYSQDEDMWFQIPDQVTRQRVLIIDDVVARASVGEAVGKAVQEHGGILVGFGTYFDKVFQGGLQKINEEIKIPCFSVIRIAGIEDGNIVLMEEDKALRPL